MGKRKNQREKETDEEGEILQQTVMTKQGKLSHISSISINSLLKEYEEKYGKEENSRGKTKKKKLNLNIPFKRVKYKGGEEGDQEAEQNTSQKIGQLGENTRSMEKLPFSKRKYKNYSDVFVGYYGFPKMCNFNQKSAKTKFSILNNQFSISKFA